MNSAAQSPEPTQSPTIVENSTPPPWNPLSGINWGAVGTVLSILIAVVGATLFILESDKSLQVSIHDNKTKLEVLEERVSHIQDDVREIDDKLDRALSQPTKARYF